MSEWTERQKTNMTKKIQRLKITENPYKVGDILHHSWGYDQTNADFYQVVAATTATVSLHKIGVKTVPGSQGFMSESLMPVKGKFLENYHHALTRDSNGKTTGPVLKKVSGYLQPTNGLPKYFIPVPYGWCDLWEGKPEYSSHYA